jgi:Mce-associated membrane protein
MSNSSPDLMAKAESAETSAAGGGIDHDADAEAPTRGAEGEHDHSPADPQHADAVDRTAIELREVSPAQPTSRRSTRIVAYGLIPTLAFVLAIAGGYLKYRDESALAATNSASASVRAATNSTVALLSYQADTASQTLNAAENNLTGPFRDSYAALIHDVVIPGATEKRISSIANIPAAASVSAAPDHAVVLVFINQAITVGAGAPTETASCVRVTLDKVADRWLISQFDPI